jgi:hypothetical protein
MTVTYEKIATTTLSSNQGTVTFSSIPQTYTDLRVIIRGGIVDNGFFIGFRVGNGSVNTSTIYSNTVIREETGVLSGRYSGKTLGAFYEQGNNNSVTHTVIADFMNYSNTTTYKSYLTRNGSAASGFVGAIAGLVQTTSAINIIEIAECGMGSTGFFNYGNMLSGSTFTLYGIKAE